MRGEEFPDGHEWYGQVLQWRTWLWLHQARRRRSRRVRAHHCGRAGGIEGSERRTAHLVRGRAGQEGQGPQGGEPRDPIVVLRVKLRVTRTADEKIPAAWRSREVVVGFF